MSKEENNNKINKIIPSKLEKSVEQILYKTLGKHIPKNITPNQITMIGALGGLIGIICAYLSKFNVLFLIGTIGGILCHLICDDLDGYVARTRKMTSKAGSYLDLLTDILHITYLIIALTIAGVIKYQISMFLIPVYALIIFTAMNDMLYFKQFLFPQLGPVETHLFFIALCIGTMIFKNNQIININSINFNLADLMCIIGGLLMNFEMVRLQVKLFNNLTKLDKEERKS